MEKLFFQQLQNNTQKILSRILQLTVVRFLQFAGSKATEYELMECCIVAHLTRKFPRIHGISLITHKRISLFLFANFFRLFPSVDRSKALSYCDNGVRTLSQVPFPIFHWNVPFPETKRQEIKHNIIHLIFHATFSSQFYSSFFRKKKICWEEKKI